MDNLEEMDKFLEKYNLPKVNQKEIENLNRPITSTEIETVIKNLPTNKAQDQMASQVNSTKNLEKSLMATHSSILAWKTPWTEEPVGYSRWGHKESDMTE